MITKRKVAGLVLLLSSCTPSEIRSWQDWYHRDEEAAEQFVRDGCGGECEPARIEEDTEASESSDTPDHPGESDGDDGGGTIWDALAQCESNGNWHINTGNGYYGGLQFALVSWRATGGSGYPHENSRAEQIRRGEILQDMQGWNAWPTCARKLGLI